MGFLQGACEAPVVFALVLRVALTERWGWLSTELEQWTYADDITLATTAELAPLVMTQLRETLENHFLELRSDESTACCPIPEKGLTISENK